MGSLRIPTSVGDSHDAAVLGTLLFGSVFSLWAGDQVTEAVTGEQPFQDLVATGEVPDVSPTAGAVLVASSFGINALWISLILTEIAGGR